MRIAIASDHGGFRLKQEVVAFLAEQGIDYQDFGTDSEESVDYPDYASKVCEGVRQGEDNLGILLCGTGQGMMITANKYPGIRAALCHDTFSARMAREHNNANILVMGGRVIGPGLARDIVQSFLNAEFQGGRHQRRVNKISTIEAKFTSGEER